MSELNFKSPFKFAPWKPEPTALISEAQYDLYRAGFDWVSKCNGVHLIVYVGKKVVADVWPTTGKYSIRNANGSASKKVYNGNIQNMTERITP